MTEEPPGPPVPAAAALARDFVNTEDRELGTDELASARLLVVWLREHGLGELPPPRREQLELARSLRAGLRHAMEQNHDGTSGVPPGLREALPRLPVALSWDEAGPVLAASGAGVPAALARVGIAALEAAAAGSWSRLKICSADDCAWAYYDHSRNRSRHWCEYGCGNKAKTRAYRERLRAGAR